MVDRTNSVQITAQKLLPVSEAVSDSANPEPSNIVVDPLTHRGLYNLRNVFAISSGFNHLINKYKLSRDQVFEPDPVLKEVVLKFLENEKINPDDFLYALKLVLNRTAEDLVKIQVLKTLISLDQEDYVFNIYLSPLLELAENTYPKQQAISLLQGLDHDKQREALGRFDFSKVKKVKAFAESLLKISEPVSLLNFLNEKNDTLLGDTFNCDQDIEGVEKLQLVTEEILKTFDDLGYLQQKDLEKLYKTSVNAMVSELVSKIINKDEVEFGQRVYKSVLFSEPEEDLDSQSLQRLYRRKFNTLGHYVALDRTLPIPDFEKVLEKESNPFLVAGAAFYLSQRMESMVVLL